MFEGVVLGADPGTASLGLAAVRQAGSKLTLVWAGTVRTSPGTATEERLHTVYREVRQAVHEHGPRAVAIERLLWGRNTGSAMEVARASGAIMVAAAQAGVPVAEYPPLHVKMAVTGVGNAPKEQVRRALSHILGPEGIASEPDAADAVAVAVCHLHQSRLARVIRMAAR